MDISEPSVRALWFDQVSEVKAVRYEILGPLCVTDAEAAASLSARKLEILLAVLLIRSNQLVTIDQLFTEIWQDNPPRRATASLHVYISQLRKFLSRPGRPESPIVTRPPGYLLHVGPGELDMLDFQELVHRGRVQARAGQHEEACASFSASLDLWRGPVPRDLAGGPIVKGFVTWAEEAWLETIELLVESKLILGRYRECVGWLYSLIAENPLREAFYRQLMVALYRSERQADALRVYQSVRKSLRDELGLEPGRALQKLQQAILMADEPGIQRAG
jgi:DNA-binding SARP family transcriptional activator